MDANLDAKFTCSSVRLRILSFYPHVYGGAYVTIAALRILPKTFTRPMELRTARWADINFETKE